MQRLRSRSVLILFFGLLSLGQAYPFSMAWGMSSPKNHLCCCKTERPRPCGCDHGHSLQKKKFSCHKQEEAGPQFSPAPCGKKEQASSLNFRGETCLPRFVAFSTPDAEEQCFDLPFRPIPEVSAVPESPPPRRSSLLS